MFLRWRLRRCVSPIQTDLFAPKAQLQSAMPKLLHANCGYLFQILKCRFKTRAIQTCSSHIHCPPEHPARDSKMGLELNEVKLKEAKSIHEESKLSSENQVLCETSTISESLTVETPAPRIAHPWPEWMDLMELLLKKGYLDGIGNPFTDAERGAKDSNLTRTACLNFGRDRFDIIRYLSRKDMQVAVGVGCPSIDRKLVNSAKRLRAQVGLDEGNTCSSCSLRGDCNRAYVLAREDEGARTVDIMRILLTFGLDPITRSIENKSCQKKSVKESVRKLLKEIIEFTEINKEQEPSEQDCPTHEDQIRVPTRQGDWNCPKCNFLNFAKNIRCLRCNGMFEEILWKMNEDHDHLPLKKGDWLCEKCNFLNFAKNSKCLRCRENPPIRQLNPGEWQCPSCNYVNFRKNMACLRCDHRRPKASTTSSPLAETTHENASNHPLNEAKSIMNGADGGYQPLAKPKRLKESKSLNMWRSVTDDNQSEDKPAGFASDALQFMDFPIAGGRSELSQNKLRIEKWKSEMLERKRRASKAKERTSELKAETPAMPHILECDDEELADWFGPGR